MTPPDCLRVIHRDGTATTIPMRRDEDDRTKWHLEEPLALQAHETADLIIGGKVVDQLRHEPGRARLNTLFWAGSD